jgi:glycosyltransferase involved in cell wall biosynthesis
MNQVASAEMIEFPDKPLVTVIVVTYNSGKTVQETLDSIASQEYPNLELVISDDNSQDNTLQLVDDWRDRHESRFREVRVLCSPINQGLCRNAAKGFAHARGEWVKLIAGDDLLLTNAVRHLIDMAAKRDHAVIVSLIAPFASNRPSDASHAAGRPSVDDMAIIEAGGDVLLQTMYWRNLIPAPGALIRRAAYEAIGGIDLDFTHLEDWPLWLRLLRAGRTFGLLRETLVGYRVAPDSLSTARAATTLSKPYIDDLLLFYRKYQKGELSPLRRFDRSIEMLRCSLARGALRERPRLYNCTRVLHAISPASWKRLARRAR